MTPNAKSKPQVGDTFHCEKCGMQLEVTIPYRGQRQNPVFLCCGGEMRRGDSANQTLTPEAARGDYIA
jgi:hypothetical protein